MIERQPDRRRKAEAEIATEITQTAHADPGPANADSLSPEQVRALMHELRVHQIELEMQNEELRLLQVAMDSTRARYFDLYDLAPIGYCTVSAQGLILQSNLKATALLGLPRKALEGQPLSRFIRAADQNTYYFYSKKVMTSGAPPPCELGSSATTARHFGCNWWPPRAMTKTVRPCCAWCSVTSQSAARHRPSCALRPRRLSLSKASW